MSVVAVRVYDNKIVMAADSITVLGWSKDTKQDHVKIVNINNMIIGGCGYAEETSLFQKFIATHKPEAPTDRSVTEFVVEFAKWKKEFTGNYSIDNTYLFAYEGHVFLIEHFLIYEVKEYCAIGAGMDFANAALYLGHDAETAVKVACDLCCMVAEPIISYTMNKE